MKDLPKDVGRVLVAMSGGVDSSVAAALLQERGVDLVGVTLHLWDAEGQDKVGRCCAPEDRDDARRSCEHLGIPHYVVDERASFRRHVVEPFLADYERGITPSPCVHCNRTVKLSWLVGLADELGCSHVATGHYARVERDPSGPRLFRGRDVGKDQTYFLFGLGPSVVDRMLFPLGEMIKDDTRAEAARLGMPNASKPDSQELCFVPDGDIAGFVRRHGHGDARPGRFVDGDGNEIGRHDGIVGYTVGQRRGLALGGGAKPRYVLRIASDTGDVVVGEGAALLGSELRAGDASWLRRPPADSFRAAVQIRYRHRAAPATVTLEENGFGVRFDEPQRALTPGQAAVVYLEDEVVGGGFIQAR